MKSNFKSSIIAVVITCYVLLINMDLSYLHTLHQKVITIAKLRKVEHVTVKSMQYTVVPDVYSIGLKQDVYNNMSQAIFHAENVQVSTVKTQLSSIEVSCRGWPSNRSP